MPEFLTLLSPEEARNLLYSHLPERLPEPELVDVPGAMGRVTAAGVLAPHALPEFARSTVDGYAVRASDTLGASESLPAYLTLTGEVPMGKAPALELDVGHCALIHTGGMLPRNATAVVMLEFAQTIQARISRAPSQQSDQVQIEVYRAVADRENVIDVGEDVTRGSLVLRQGRRLRSAEIGGLLALGLATVHVTPKPLVGIISSGDEVIEPTRETRPGQVRDINTYTLGALVTASGGTPRSYGIVTDDFGKLRAVAALALSECELVLITAGSSASARDTTASVIASLGSPGVLVHGVNMRPGKPTILGVCDGKPVLGLPGNPVSALVNGYLFVVPLVERLLGLPPGPRASVPARLAVNLPSLAGREDWWPVMLAEQAYRPAGNEAPASRTYLAEPIFAKSNLIFSLVAADGLIRIPPDATGLSAGDLVDVMLLQA